MQARQPSKAKYINDYLQFLGLQEEPATLDYLRRIMLAQLYKVPFDGSNFTVHKPKSYALHNRTILEQMIQGRGIICYQVHGALNKLFQLLGFDSMLVSATQFRYEDSEHLEAANIGRDTHSVIIVAHQDQEYMIDLTWGNSFDGPLQVNSDNHANPPGTNPRRCIKEQDLYQQQVFLKKEWLTEYQFRVAPQKTKNFADDVELIASDFFYLSKYLLLMRSDRVSGFSYLQQDIYSKSTGVLFFNNISTTGEPSALEIRDKAMADAKLQEFGVTEENRQEILRICNF